MPPLRRLALAAATISALIFASPSVRGYDRSADLQRTTMLRFTTDVALPRRRLPAGTYVFELADPMHARALVRVSSRDRRQLVVTLFTRVVTRPATLGAEAVVSFGEDVDGTPLVAAWWPAGDESGREFIY